MSERIKRYDYLFIFLSILIVILFFVNGFLFYLVNAQDNNIKADIKRYLDDDLFFRVRLFDKISSLEDKIFELENRYVEFYENFLCFQQFNSTSQSIENSNKHNFLVLKNLRVTSYCEHNITASGKIPNERTAAVSRDLFEKWDKKFGKNIILFEKKDNDVVYIGKYYIEDLTSKRLKNTVDIYKNSCKEAKKFGLKENCIGIVY